MGSPQRQRTPDDHENGRPTSTKSTSQSEHGRSYPEQPPGRIEPRTRRRNQEPCTSLGTTSRGGQGTSRHADDETKRIRRSPPRDAENLHATEKDEHGRTATQPTKELKDMLSMLNVSHIVTHLHSFLRNRLGCAVRFPTGFCTAIRNGNFLEDFTDAPGAMRIFCFGPQFTSQTTNNTAGDNPEAIAQMQLKLTETTSGLSDKDIKTMTKLAHAVPSDFKDLADFCQVMAAVHELICGGGSQLTEMLTEWFLYTTGGNGNAGSTVGHLQGMASADPTMTCRLAWFIEKRRQQFLLSCLTADDEEGIDYRALDFHDVRQSIKDDNFHFKAYAFRLDRLPGGRRKEDKKHTASTD